MWDNSNFSLLCTCTYSPDPVKMPQVLIWGSHKNSSRYQNSQMQHPQIMRMECIHPLINVCIVLQILAITNNATINICVQLLLWTYLFFQIGKWPRVEWLNVADVGLILKKLSNSSKVVVVIYLLTCGA